MYPEWLVLGLRTVASRLSYDRYVVKTDCRSIMAELTMSDRFVACSYSNCYRPNQVTRCLTSSAYPLLIIEISQAIFTHGEYLLTLSVVPVPMLTGRVLPLGLFFKSVIPSSTKAEAS